MTPIDAAGNVLREAIELLEHAGKTTCNPSQISPTMVGIAAWQLVRVPLAAAWNKGDRTWGKPSGSLSCTAGSSGSLVLQQV